MFYFLFSVFTLWLFPLYGCIPIYFYIPTSKDISSIPKDTNSPLWVTLIKVINFILLKRNTVIIVKMFTLIMYNQIISKINVRKCEKKVFMVYSPIYGVILPAVLKLSLVTSCWRSIRIKHITLVSNLSLHNFVETVILTEWLESNKYGQH